MVNVSDVFPILTLANPDSESDAFTVNVAEVFQSVGLPVTVTVGLTLSINTLTFIVVVFPALSVTVNLATLLPDAITAFPFSDVISYVAVATSFAPGFSVS